MLKQKKSIIGLIGLSGLRKVAMVFGKILKRINITYQPNTLYFGHYPETTTNVYGHKNFINDEMINYNSINFKNIVSGGFHLLMLTSEGSLYSKESGGFGQLGHGSELTESNVPLCIEPLPKIKYISSGYAYNCVISEDGDIYSWGAGENGRLGLGDTDNRSKPTLVNSDVKFKSVACGSTFTVALSTDNEIYSWGQYCATGHIEEEDILVPKRLKFLKEDYFTKYLLDQVHIMFWHYLLLVNYLVGDIIGVDNWVLVVI